MNTATIIQPGEMERPAGEIPFIHIPERNWVFRDRAWRLNRLAEDHSMKDLLLFAASICDAQQEVLNVFPKVPLPTEAQLRLCRDNCMPPLSVQSWPRDEAWREALWQITNLVQEKANPLVKSSLVRLREMDSAAVEAMADAVLRGYYEKLDLAVAPFIAAALQVYWTHMATTLGDRAFGRSDVTNLCPVCASRPSSSIVRIGPQQGLRYLSCSMCETQWHMVRVKCSNCESTKGISYFAVEGSSGAVKAESCEECDSYLKIMYMDKDPHTDPVADDLATLTLDLKMSDSGILRSGPLLFLMPAPDTAA